MSRMRAVGVFIVLVFGFMESVYAQHADTRSQGRPLLPEAKLSILSLVHVKNPSVPYTSLLLKRLHDSAHVNDLVLETSKANAYLFNLYIQTGDTAVLSILYPGSAPGKSNFADEMRKWNLAGRPVTVHGIDFEWPESLTAIKYLCERAHQTDNDMYRYIVDRTDTIKALMKDEKLWKERQRMLKSSRSIYAANKAVYDKITDGDFSMQAVFDNPASESNFAGRDAAMADNLKSILPTIKGNILMCSGSYHIETNGKLYRKLLNSPLLRKEDIKVYSMLGKNCDVGGLYFKATTIPYAGNSSFVSDTAVAARIFAQYATRDELNIIPADSAFYAAFPVKRVNCIDYILTITCSN